MTIGVEKVAFEHTLSRLIAQHTDLLNLRNQASISAGITGLVGTLFASLLGVEGAQKAVLGGSILGLQIVGAMLMALICFSLFFSATVLIWYEKFTFGFDPKTMLEEARKHPSLENFFAAYVRDGKIFFAQNEKKIESAQNRLWWAMVLGWAQVIPWIVLIVGAADG